MDVVLNDLLLDAMIDTAAAAGVRPDRQQEKFFIVLQHYLGSSGSLLFVSRMSGEGPVLWRDDCEPDTSADARVQTYVSGLTAQQRRALVTYRDSVVTADAAESTAPEMPSTMEDMVRVPAGAFQRGDGTTAVLEAFVIDVYEVTNAEYQRFVADGGYAEAAYWRPEGWSWRESKGREQSSYWDNEDFNAAQQPVVGVTWYEADAYCRWAGKSLPEEPQWDKACRGIDGRAFPWGSETLAEEGGGPSSFTLPVAVGDMPQTPSPYGIYDLAGNVLEWSGTANDRGARVLCGGSGASDSPHVGCGVRSVLLPGVAANFIGFRCQQAAAQ